jgi:hypothetical protein
MTEKGLIRQVNGASPLVDPAATLQMGCLYDTLHCIDGNSEVKYASPKSRESKEISLMPAEGTRSL